MVTTVRQPTRTSRPTPSALAVVLTLLVVGALGGLVALTVAPRLVGAIPIAVQGSSMEPALSAGDLAMVRPTDPQYLQVGDVVAFRPEPSHATLETHRVLDVVRDGDRATGFVTSADAGETSAGVVAADQVQGRVVYSVPYVGPLVESGWGTLVATVVGAGLVVHLVRTARRSVRA